MHPLNIVVGMNNMKTKLITIIMHDLFVLQRPETIILQEYPVYPNVSIEHFQY